MTAAFAAASLAYFRATGLNMPQHVRPDTVRTFLTSEAGRFSTMSGTHNRLLCAVRAWDAACANGTELP